MKFIVTFGQKYRREPHPTFLEAHPDGWVSVDADTETEARAKVVARFGIAWSDLYPELDFLEDRYLYPRGELLAL